MPDLFLSYAHEDMDRIKSLVSDLEKEGWSIFWDRKIPAGETWRSYIGKALLEARCVVVVWSIHSIHSNWVIEEADDSKRRGLFVPVLLDVVDQPLGFREIQAADLSNWHPGHSSLEFDQLIEAIHARMNAHKPVMKESTKFASDNALQPPSVIARKNSFTPTLSRKSAYLLTVAALLSVLFAAFFLVKHPLNKWIAQDSAQPVSENTTRPERTMQPLTTPVLPPNQNKESNQTAPIQDSVFKVKAVIDDPDGYSNLRSVPSVKGSIVAKVIEGELFYTYVQQGNWWQVKTASGKVGYMHVSRIRILK